MHLRRPMDANSFALPEAGTELLIFALRGCIPAHPDDPEFAAERSVEIVDVNYRNPRCTFTLWQLADDRIAVFPGGTVPHEKYVRRARERSGVGANEMMTGEEEDAGPWRRFRARAYDARSQERFPYALLDGLSLGRVADLTVPVSPRLRYGSSGDRVRDVQRAGGSRARRTVDRPDRRRGW